MNKSKKYKVDFHTHSILSYDGGLSNDDYSKILDSGILDCIAITDHSEVDFAMKMKEKYGSKIIVGEEMKTEFGDIIGLFLNSKIKNGMSLNKTINEIKKQGGIVFLPHPSDPMRSGIFEKEFAKVIDDIDIIEVFNARYLFPGGIDLSRDFSDRYRKLVAVGSDAHSVKEVGRTYSLVGDIPTVNNILTLLEESSYVTDFVRPWHYLMPKFNQLKKILFRRNVT